MQTPTGNGVLIVTEKVIVTVLPGGIMEIPLVTVSPDIAALTAKSAVSFSAAFTVGANQVPKAFKLKLVGATKAEKTGCNHSCMRFNVETEPPPAG